MDDPSDQNSSGNQQGDEQAEAERLVAEWRKSFRPSHTSIDGGLFPSRLGSGIVGFEDYDSFEPSGELVDLQVDDETRAKLQRMLDRAKKK